MVFERISVNSRASEDCTRTGPRLREMLLGRFGAFSVLYFHEVFCSRKSCFLDLVRRVSSISMKSSVKGTWS